MTKLLNMNHRGSKEDDHGGEEKVSYLALNQTLVVFDVEQPLDAQQKLILRRLSGVGPVAFRFLTNSPTRYLVCPNQGVITNDQPLEVKITLVKNKFTPEHTMQVHAAACPSQKLDSKLWQDNAKVQIFHLDLGTTMMSIDRTSSTIATVEKTDIDQLLTNTSCEEKRAKELKGILDMTQYDLDVLKHNIKQAEDVQKIVKEQLEQKKVMEADMKKILGEKESEYMRKRGEVVRLQNEYNSLRDMNKSRQQQQQQQNCTIS